MGSFLDNLSGMIRGTTPVMQQTGGGSYDPGAGPGVMGAGGAGTLLNADNQPISYPQGPMMTQGADPGQIQAAPQFSPTGQTAGGLTGQGGLLDQFNAPDARGISMADRVGAAGQIAQGDPNGADSYLQQQRLMQDQLNQRLQQQAVQANGLAALKSSINPDGSVNAQTYLSKIGGQPGTNPDDVIKTLGSLSPQMQAINAKGGGIYGVTKQPFGSGMTANELISPPARKPPPLMKYDDNGNLVMDPEQIAAQGAAAGAKSGATIQDRVTLAKLRPQAGGAGLRSPLPAGATPGLPP
jgi:hypothetical protein